MAFLYTLHIGKLHYFWKQHEVFCTNTPAPSALKFFLDINSWHTILKWYFKNKLRSYIFAFITVTRSICAEDITKHFSGCSLIMILKSIAICYTFRKVNFNLNGYGQWCVYWSVTHLDCKPAISLPKTFCPTMNLLLFFIQIWTLSILRILGW